jgi:hypothetical protein
MGVYTDVSLEVMDIGGGGGGGGGGSGGRRRRCRVGG